MKDFASPNEFAEFLGKLLATMPVAQQIGLDGAAAIIQIEAKAEIGHYQDAAGQFEAWPELADFTKADRIAQGYSENDPLLRSGKLRDSIKRNAGTNEAYVGSDDDIAVYQELGTETIPARSFLGGAAVRKGDEAVEVLADVLFEHLASTVRKHYETDIDD